jgi:hypothetical protein
MKDMKTHLEKLREQAAECAILCGEAATKEKREFFSKLHAHLTYLADQAECAINGTVVPGTFLGRKTYEPFPSQED